MSEQPLLIGPTLNAAIAEARIIVTDAIAHYPHVAVVGLFSGGNDSSVMLHLCRQYVDFALHINTGIGVEETRTFARNTAGLWGITFTERKTDPAWYVADVLAHGFPGPMQHRVMYHNLKRERLRELRRELCKRGEKLMLLTGERAYESQRRMGYGNATARVDDGCIWVNPIHFFTDWHMAEYRKQFDLPRNPVSAMMHKSGECLCGAFAHRGELRELELWFPEAAAYIHGLEEQAASAGHGKRALWAWGSEDRRASKAPGPMCSSCHQLPLEETG